MQRALTLTDIPWLRQAAHVGGTSDMPREIAAKLLSGGFVEQGLKGGALTITSRGRLALTRLT